MFWKWRGLNQGLRSRQKQNEILALFDCVILQTWPKLLLTGHKFQSKFVYRNLAHQQDLRVQIGLAALVRIVMTSQKNSEAGGLVFINKDIFLCIK